MKRTLLPLIFCLATLGILEVPTFADDAPTSRQLYSSRQPGARRAQPVFENYVVPRMAPAQPILSEPAEEIIFEGPVFIHPAPAANPEPDQPLSGIDFPSLPSPKGNEEPKPTPIVEFPARTPIAFPPSDTQIDEFYARLAKLQLEKKQLAETLTLIGKIKNDLFKVKTLVELAEYVAHDTNYKREADQLFVLAQNGIDALANGKPIVLAAPEAERKPVEEKVPPRQPTLLERLDTPQPTPQRPPLLDDLLDDEPVVEETQPVTPPRPARPPLLDDLDDEPVVGETQPATPPRPARPPLLDDLDDEPVVEETQPATSPRPARPSLLDDLDDEPVVEETQPATPPRPARPPLLDDLDDEPVVEMRRSATPLLDDLDDEPVVEDKKPATAPSGRPSFLSTDDDDEPAVNPAPKESALPARQPTRTRVSALEE